jgi:hypothetical protein
MSKRKTKSWWKEELNINTQKEVSDKIRNIVKSLGDNEPVDEINTKFLIKVLSHHHDFEKKCGVGIKHLEIRTNSSWNGPSKGIWIIRNDDTEEDISWVTALKPDGRPSIKEDISNAARYEISSQIHDYHDNGDCSICELCKNDMSRYNILHVDHIKKFEDLFLDFLTIKNITYSDIQIKDLGVKSEFKDRDLAKEWFDFHKQNATLRLVHKKCNLERKK